MEVSNFILKTGRGKNTTLDKAYSNLINKVLSTDSESEQERWETYNLIIKELLKAGHGDFFPEIKYRLTDGENPNEVIVDIIQRSENVSGLVWQLKRKIDEYVEEDYFKRFA